MKTLAGLFLATLVALTAGCAQKDWIDRTLVTVDVTGTWYGRGSGGSGTTGVATAGFAMQLEQQGATVKGSIFPPSGAGAGTFSGPIDGAVAGDVFRFRNARGDVEGELTVSGDEMTGRMSRAGQGSGGTFPVVLQRVNPSSPPTSPPR
jgi:hypothetical protein